MLRCQDLSEPHRSSGGPDDLHSCIACQRLPASCGPAQLGNVRRTNPGLAVGAKLAGRRDLALRSPARRHLGLVQLCPSPNPAACTHFTSSTHLQPVLEPCLGISRCECAHPQINIARLSPLASRNPQSSLGF